MTAASSEWVFGKYEIQNRLAIGGMGEVFFAIQRGVSGFERPVILKSLLPDLAQQQELINQFLDEARVAATLNHPNVVSIYEVGLWNGTYYLAMEFIRGRNLAQLIRASLEQNLRLPPAVSARVVREAALGLHHAHQASDANGRKLRIIHRDISPQNIMLREDGVTKVVDFGIASATNRSTRTATGTLKGKLAYMAPEQILAQPLTALVDEFALGIVFWELLTCHRLFKADNDMQLMKAILKAPIPRPDEVAEDVPRPLADIVMRMLARDPLERFDSLAAVADALEGVVVTPTPAHSPEAFMRQLGTENLAVNVKPAKPASDNFVVDLNDQRAMESLAPALAPEPVPANAPFGSPPAEASRPAASPSSSALPSVPPGSRAGAPKKRGGPTLATCQAHRAVAGWQCTVCLEPLCPDCAATKVVYPTSVTVCSLCGELATELKQKHTHAASLTERLPGAFAFPFTMDGAPAWLGISLFLWLVSYGGLLGLMIGWSGTIAALFGLTRSSSNGKDHIELTDFGDWVDSLALPLIRFVVALAPGWVGILAAVRFGSLGLGIAAVLVTMVWSPTAYIGAATRASLVHLLNPLRVLSVSASMGKDFGVYLGSLLALGVLFLVTIPLSLLVNRFLLVPILSGVLATMLLTLAPFIGARIAGLVLLLHGPSFGWGLAGDTDVGVLSGQEPRGQVPEPKPEARKKREAIELEPELSDAQPAQMADRFAALEVDPSSEAPPDVAPLDVSLLDSHGANSAREIRAAIQAGNTEVALDGFRATGQLAAAELSFDELMWLGQTAAAHIDYESAELAFRKADERGTADSELRQRLRVMWGRLLGEKLGRLDDARAQMQRVVAEAGESKAAAFASRWLTEH